MINTDIKIRHNVEGLSFFSFAYILIPVIIFLCSCSRNQSSNLTLKELHLSAHTVSGYWEERDFMENDKATWSGTAFVIKREKERLVLATNSHVLGLEGLSKADDMKDMKPEVSQYKLEVFFASGKSAPVIACADNEQNIDLALLIVSSKGLVEGEDYVILESSKAQNIKIGDEAVAVGSPRGLAGTHTFGRVSAIRGDNTFRLIQTDAAINPGNSGGPLFIKSSNDTYKWIGVNTFILGSDNLGFAIDATHLSSAKWFWFDASPQGAVSVIRKKYGREAQL